MIHRQDIKSVKFYALIPKPEGAPEVKGTFFAVGRVENNKTTKALSIVYGPSYIIVHQETQDGERKQYLYKLDDINGRIEVTE